MDVQFNAYAGVPYTIWLRLKALDDAKFNDALWVQFSDATSGGLTLYPIGTTSALLVNLATDASASSLNGWGWVNGAYWLNQVATVTFASNGPHTLRVQVREDGVQFDQIVLSPQAYLTSAPGGVSNDATIVTKPPSESPRVETGERSAKPRAHCADASCRAGSARFPRPAAASDNCGCRRRA